MTGYIVGAIIILSLIIIFNEIGRYFERRDAKREEEERQRTMKLMVSSGAIKGSYK